MKFCTFCGSETPNAHLAAEHKRLYDEYQQVSALLALEIELQKDIIDNHSNLSTDELRAIINRLASTRELVISDKKYREHKFNSMKMLFTLDMHTDKEI